MRYLILGVLLQGVCNALLSQDLSISDSFRFNAVAFALAALSAIILRRLRSRPRRPTRPISSRDIVVLNLATAITFLSFYTALVWVPASVAAGVEAGVAPVAALAFAGLRGSPKQWVVVIALLASSVAFGMVQYDADPTGSSLFVVGLGLATVAGWGMATIAAIAHRLGTQGIRAVDVLVVRYHLTYIIAAIAAIAVPQNSTDGLGWGFLVMYALGGVVVPLWFYQKGMEVTPPVKAMGLITLVPIVSFVTERFQGNPITPLSVLLVCTVAGLAILATRVSARSSSPPVAQKPISDRDAE